MIPELSIMEGLTVLKPTLYFILGIAFYAILVFILYRRIAAKNIFELNLRQYNTAQHPALEKIVRSILYVIEYIILFPIFAFIWFAVIVILLSLLTQNQPITHLALISIAILGAIRITAYINENISRDLAKLLPLTLLGVFIIDFNVISLTTSIELLKQSVLLTKTAAYYLILIVIIEAALRILHSFTKLFVNGDEKK